MDITSFVDSWNSDSLTLSSKDNTNVQPYRLRPSTLGQPAYVTVIEFLIHLYGNRHDTSKKTKVTYGRRADIFEVGHVTEERIIQTMRSAGMVGIDYQVPCSQELEGFTIEGTADLVIGDTVYDIKTAASSSYSSMLKGYNLTKYRTQLGLYKHALGLDNAALIIYNKDNSELTLLPVETSGVIGHVSAVLSLLREIQEAPPSVQDALEFMYGNCVVEEPVPQMKNKQPTGRYLVPPGLRFNTTVRDIMWHTEVRDGVTYITQQNDNMEGAIVAAYI